MRFGFDSPSLRYLRFRCSEDSSRRIASVTACERVQHLGPDRAFSSSTNFVGTDAVMTTAGPSELATLRPAPARFPPCCFSSATSISSILERLQGINLTTVAN